MFTHTHARVGYVKEGCAAGLVLRRMRTSWNIPDRRHNHAAASVALVVAAVVVLDVACVRAGAGAGAGVGCCR